MARMQVAVNGRRLKEGPYTTLMRPARLHPGKSLLLGPGVRGAQPGEEQELQLQLVNELDENLTTCSTSGEDVVGVVAQAKCASLRADACRARPDCEWLPVEGAVGAGVCNTLRQRELVEIFLEPIKSPDEALHGSGAAAAADAPKQAEQGQALASAQAGVGHSEIAAADEERKAGVVRSCDRGTYTLSYSMAEPGRYRLFVKVAGLNLGCCLALPRAPCPVPRAPCPVPRAPCGALRPRSVCRLNAASACSGSHLWRPPLRS